MHGTIVILIALGGLGCQNKSCHASPAPPAGDGWCGAHVAFPSFAPPSPAAYAPIHDHGDAADYSRGRSLRSTLCSFVLGRDPDVPTARDIEATFYSGSFGAYRSLASIPSARRPPSE